MEQLFYFIISSFVPSKTHFFYVLFNKTEQWQRSVTKIALADIQMTILEKGDKY